MELLESQKLRFWIFPVLKGLRGITFKHHIFLLPKLPYLNHIEKYVKIKDLFNIIIPSEDTKLSELNQYQKSDEAGFIIYADLECLIEKIDGLQNNRENSSTTKVAEHILSGFSMSAIPQLKNRK